MLKIRLRRMGSRHRPFYRVVVSDSRRTPRAAALDELGYYDPRRSPSVFKVDMEKVDHWISKGAQPSETVSQLVRKARKGELSGEVAESDAKVTEAVTEAAAEEKSEEKPAEEPVEVKAEAAEEATEASDEAAADADNAENKDEA